MKKRTENIKALISLFMSRLTRCERECENIIERKLDVQQQTLDEEQKKQNNLKTFEEMKEEYKKNKTFLELYKIQEKENKEEVFYKD